MHETLATDATDEVDFDSVVRRVVKLVQEGLTSPDRPLRVEVNGGVGELPGEVAMPLAVALVELVQNAVDHARPGAGASVEVEVARDHRDLIVRVCDDGVGVPDGFSLDRDAGLGLAIVRTFVVSDLGGTITIGRRAPRSREVRWWRSGCRGDAVIRWWSADPTSGSGLGGGPLLAACSTDHRRSSGGAAPDTGVLVGAPRELEAGGLGVALIADILGVLDLLDRHPGGADGEEEARVGVATARILSPVNTAGKASAVSATSVPLGYGDPSDVSVGPDTRNGFYRWARKKLEPVLLFQGQLRSLRLFSKIKYRNSYLWPHVVRRGGRLWLWHRPPP